MKKWLTGLKLTKKLLIAPSMAITFLVIFGLVAYVGFIVQRKTMDNVVNQRFGYYQSAADIIIKLNQIQKQMYKLQGLVASKALYTIIKFTAGQQLESTKQLAEAIDKLIKSPGLTKEEQGVFQEISEEPVNMENIHNSIRYKHRQVMINTKIVENICPIII